MGMFFPHIDPPSGCQLCRFAPIIITPRSVRAGNSSGGGKSSYRDVPGYSGGDGTGPLIYNP